MVNVCFSLVVFSLRGKDKLSCRTRRHDITTAGHPYHVIHPLRYVFGLFENTKG